MSISGRAQAVTLTAIYHPPILWAGQQKELLKGYGAVAPFSLPKRSRKRLIYSNRKLSLLHSEQNPVWLCHTGTEPCHTPLLRCVFKEVVTEFPIDNTCCQRNSCVMLCLKKGPLLLCPISLQQLATCTVIQKCHA